MIYVVLFVISNILNKWFYFEIGSSKLLLGKFFIFLFGFYEMDVFVWLVFGIFVFMIEFFFFEFV